MPHPSQPSRRPLLAAGTIGTDAAAKSAPEGYTLVTVVPSDGPSLAAFLDRETAFWHKLIRERKLAVD